MRKGKKKIIIVANHSICFCETALVLFLLVGGIHGFLVFLSIQFYFMNMNSSACKWKINHFIDGELICSLSLLQSPLFHRKKIQCSIFKGTIKALKKNLVFLGEH